MATPRDIVALAKSAGIELQQWQVEFLDRLYLEPGRTSAQRATDARRAAREWLDRANTLESQAKEAGLTEFMWASLHQEAQVLRACAAQVFEAVR